MKLVSTPKFDSIILKDETLKSLLDNDKATNSMNCFDISNDSISYIPTEKIKYINGSNIDMSYARQTIKIGKFLSKINSLNGNQLTPSAIEEYNHSIKAAIELTSSGFQNFELVSGQDIIKYYWYKNYAYNDGFVMKGRGTLNMSCSGHAHHLELYAENPDTIKLLILKSSTEPDKIIGRAIVWFCSEPNIVFMDKIYYVNDSDVLLFIEYAKSQQWFYREHQAKGDVSQISPKGEIKKIPMKVKVTPKEFKGYPYIDYMMYYNKVEGYLTNINPTNTKNMLMLQVYGGRGGWIDMETQTTHNAHYDPYSIVRP